MDMLSYVLGKKSGGGGDITVESLSVDENGTYTAPSGKAYSPVTVNVQLGETETWTFTMSDDTEVEKVVVVDDD